MSDSTIQQSVSVKNAKGLHLRAAELLVQVASGFQSTLLIAKDSQAVDCKSMLNLLTLGATQGTQLQVSAQGADAEAAMSAIVALFDVGFHELEISEPE